VTRLPSPTLYNAIIHHRPPVQRAMSLHNSKPRIPIPAVMSHNVVPVNTSPLRESSNSFSNAASLNKPPCALSLRTRHAPHLPSLMLLVNSVSSSDRTRNNSPKLCSKPYDQITHLDAHDSPSLCDAPNGVSTFSNQFFNTTVQLDAGVRVLSVQIHISSNPVTKARELHLCHPS
jgi:hypothetical protein